jgi:hypothetical protein
MAQNDLQGVLFTSCHNINYYSDFVYCRFGRDYGLVITQDNYTTISANIDGGPPYRRNQLGDNLIYTDWQKHNFFHANQQLIRDGGNVGIECLASMHAEGGEFRVGMRINGHGGHSITSVGGNRETGRRNRQSGVRGRKNG